MHMVSLESNEPEKDSQQLDDIDQLLEQGRNLHSNQFSKRDEVKAEIRNLHVKAMREEV